MNPTSDKRVVPKYLRPSISGDFCQMKQLPDEKRKACMVCSGRQEGKRKRTAFECVCCQKGCCQACFNQHLDS